MNTTYDKIVEDSKNALRNKDAPRLLVLRFLKSKILEKEIKERKGGEAVLSEEQVHEVLLKAAKQRKEAISQYKAAGRADLAEKEEYELQLIESYLPQMLSEEEIKERVSDVIQQTGAESVADSGKVMAALMPQIKGKADGSLVNRIVRELLESS